MIAVCDAVALFVDRARALKATFALDDTNASAVAQICRRLDGIALAIELAAARVAMLTPADIARRLDQRFRLLAGGQRSTVERHQTLRATVDWSYEMLAEPEQVLLDRLSVFAGGFSLEAAEAVTAGGVVDAFDVFDLLATLVARSLVVADTEGVDARYRLLETIRQYAQEHLDESDDGDRLRTEHAAYYAGFAEDAIAGMQGPDGIEWERRLEAEFDNLRTALTWSVDSQNVDAALRLFSIWEWPAMWNDVTLISTGREVADAVPAIVGASDHDKYPVVLAVAAFMANGRGDYEESRRLCDESIAAERRLGVPRDTLVHLALVNEAMARGCLEEAVERARTAIEVARLADNPAMLAHALGATALTQAILGDADGAFADAEAVLVLARRLVNPYVVQIPMAQAAFALGNSDPARALELARETVALDPRRRTPLPLGVAGDLAARNGDDAEALEYFAAAIRMMHWQSIRFGVGVMIVRVGTILADRDPEAAAVLDGAGEAIAPGFGHAGHTLAAREQAVAAATAALGAERRAELYARGHAMADDEAVSYATEAINRYLAADSEE
jgi:hypothetical protein